MAHKEQYKNVRELDLLYLQPFGFYSLISCKSQTRLLPVFHYHGHRISSERGNDYRLATCSMRGALRISLSAARIMLHLQMIEPVAARDRVDYREKYMLYFI